MPSRGDTPGGDSQVQPGDGTATRQESKYFFSDPEWVTEIGEGIVECDDDKDLLKRAEQPKWTQWWRYPSREYSKREGWADGRAEGWVDGEGLIKSGSKRELLSLAPMLQEASSEEGSPERD